jgi:hypothetical protein
MLGSNLVAGLIGILLVCAFLGVLIAWIKALPIVIIMIATIAAMLYDFITTLREMKENGR